MNLICGLAGCWVVLAGHPPVYALGLVFLGQFLDLFDGRAAERWGSTPRGEIFDDVADGTSFGFTVGLIVAVTFTHRSLGALIAVIYLAAVVYRLVRFVREKRRDGIAGGVTNFSGLPSPAAALLAGVSCILIPSELINAATVIIASALMVSRVPYAHFGRTILPRVPKIVRVLVLATFLVLLAQGVRRDLYMAPLVMAYASALIYLASPLFWRTGKAGADPESDLAGQ
jgi:CDP-diacylglycerol--serine O-phosphatidyltransferase